MSSHARWLICVLALSLFCIWVATPPEFKGVQADACSSAKAEDLEALRCSENLEIDADGDGENEFVLHITQSLGLDLVGGLRVLLQADIPTQNFTGEELSETANNVSRRVNALGLTEATVQVQGRDRILVELPGVRDPEQAVATIQQTALLEFVDFGGLSNQVLGLIGKEIVTSEQIRLRGELTGEEGEEDALAGRLAHPVNGLPFRTVMTGAGLQAASAVLAPAQGTGNPQWLINFEIKEDFQNIFGSFTGNASDNRWRSYWTAKCFPRPPFKRSSRPVASFPASSPNRKPIPSPCSCDLARCPYHYVLRVHRKSARRLDKSRCG